MSECTICGKEHVGLRVTKNGLYCDECWGEPELPCVGEIRIFIKIKDDWYWTDIYESLTYYEGNPNPKEIFEDEDMDLLKEIWLIDGQSVQRIRRE